MTDEQETIADIIAQKRDEAAAIRADLSCVPVRRDDQLAEADFINAEADRLEAAHRRELAAGGNAEKLREALTDAEKTLYDSSRSMYGIPPHLHALLARIRAALAEPPRNCERFRNADEALEALERHCNSSGNGCIRCPVAGSSTEEVECKIAWLFAHATEKEGDTDADE